MREDVDVALREFGEEYPELLKQCRDAGVTSVTLMVSLDGLGESRERWTCIAFKGPGRVRATSRGKTLPGALREALQQVTRG